jgi:hypothetical protein
MKFANKIIFLLCITCLFNVCKKPGYPVPPASTVPLTLLTMMDLLRRMLLLQMYQLFLNLPEFQVITGISVMEHLQRLRILLICSQRQVYIR